MTAEQRREAARFVRSLKCGECGYNGDNLRMKLNPLVEQAQDTIIIECPKGHETLISLIEDER